MDLPVMDISTGPRGTQIFIAGLTADEVIAPWVIEGAMYGPLFAAYVEKVLVAEPTTGALVVLENLATQKNTQAAETMRNAGCRFLLLQP
jgi:transposase